MREKLHKHGLIVLIVCIGFLLRILNPNFGTPVLYVIPDEVSNYISAFNMLANKTPITMFSQYPPLGSYIQIPFIIAVYLYMTASGQVKSVSEFELFLTTHEGILLFIPRILSAIFSTATIILIYLLSARLFPGKRRISILAAYFFSISLISIQFAHEGRPWSIALFFLYASIFFLFNSYFDSFKNSTYPIMSALLLIITAGIFFQLGLIGVYFFFIFYFFLLLSNNIFIRKRRILVFLFAITISVFISMTAFFKLMQFKQTASFIFDYNHSNISSLSSIFRRFIMKNSLGFFVSQLLFVEPLLLILSFGAFKKKLLLQKAYISIIFFIISYLIIAGLLFWQASRFLLPIIPFLAVFTAYTVDHIFNKVKSNVFKVIFLLIIISTSLIAPTLWTTRFLSEPTYVEARKWIDAKISPEIPIISTAVRFCGYTPSFQAIKIIQQNNPSFYERAKQHLKPDSYPDNVRNIYYSEQIIKSESSPVNIDSLVQQVSAKYVLNYYWDPEKSLIRNDPFGFTLVKRFSPLNKNIIETKISNLYDTMDQPGVWKLLIMVSRAGPFVDILKPI